MSRRKPTKLVSIPNRDFDELQYLILHLLVNFQMFQSLIGILMNCNNLLHEDYILAEFVSIPNRDFDELQS